MLQGEVVPDHEVALPPVMVVDVRRVVEQSEQLLEQRVAFRRGQGGDAGAHVEIDEDVGAAGLALAGNDRMDRRAVAGFHVGKSGPAPEQAAADLQGLEIGDAGMQRLGHPFPCPKAAGEARRGSAFRGVLGIERAAQERRRHIGDVVVEEQFLGPQEAPLLDIGDHVVVELGAQRRAEDVAGGKLPVAVELLAAEQDEAVAAVDAGQRRALVRA